MAAGETGQRADPVRVAIVGTGNIARVHAAALTATASSTTNIGNTIGTSIAASTISTGSTAASTSSVLATAGAGRPSAVIVAVADVDDGRLRAFREEFGIPAAYSRLEDLLQRERVDLVHLCTPPSVHHQQALACLRSGVSVLVEKPPAISLREFDEMSAAEGGPPWLAGVFQHRFGSGQRRLKDLAARGDVLGKPLLALCHTTWFRDQAYFDVDWRGRWDTEGGGPTMGHGIHQMDMLADVLGEWTEVSAVARTQARRVRTEDMSLAHVTFASGAVASVVNSVLSPREESYLRFDFEHGTVEVTHLYGYGDADWRITAAPGFEQDVLTAWRRGESGTRSGHAAQFGQVLAALSAGVRPPVAPADSRRTLSLAAAIYASAFTRRAVTPGDLAPGSPFYGQMNGGRPAW